MSKELDDTLDAYSAVEPRHGKDLTVGEMIAHM